MWDGWMKVVEERSEEEQAGFMQRYLHGQAGGIRCGFSARQDAFMCPNFENKNSKRSFCSKSFFSGPLASC